MEEIEIRIFDFVTNDSFDEGFEIQIFGINENRETFSIHIDDYLPFVYILVGDDWKQDDADDFIKHLKNPKEVEQSLATISKSSIVKHELVRQKKLYGFDANREHNFICIYSKNTMFINKLKSLYYDREKQHVNDGYFHNGVYTKIYETMIPPLLRFFHIQTISPSGWVKIPNDKISPNKIYTTCDYEIFCSYEDIQQIENKENSVPYKICSFDIEASSSHGDFPTAVKNYKKVGHDIVEYLINNEICEEDVEYIVKELLLNVFNFKDTLDIDCCYLINEYSEQKCLKDIKRLFSKKMRKTKKIENKLQEYFQNEEEDEENSLYKKKIKIENDIQPDIISILGDESHDNPTKTVFLIEALDSVFPEIKGDEVTYIGSTFVSYGNEKPYLNHCICVKDSENIKKESQEIECYDTESEILLAWTNLIQREDPDVIIGYNIFGFDYPFMHKRAEVLNILPGFTKLGRNVMNENTDMYELSITLASGAYDLRLLPMDGRLQIDLLTYMRREFNLSSYKLDSVASEMISDSIISYENKDDTCRVVTKNTKGIDVDSFIHFDMIGHTNEQYEDGKKFRVIELSDDGFIVDGNLNIEDVNSKLNWGLAKDDITPQDIFRMTNGTSYEKGVIAKYCIQDCNLVHQLFQKIDIMTTFIEMSKICSVPISFIVTRGQGIKLTSYIAKKCREKGTLMPLISKGSLFDAYEGAIVLEPKEGLYLEDPVACVDYSSLYPSSIISENISHDSKVWSKEYDLNDKIKKYKWGKNRGKNMIIGEQDSSGNFIYDNLPGYKYVDIKYDTFEYKRKSEKAAAVKVLNGYKIIRYAQFPNNEKAIMPAILEELLRERKINKKKAAKEEDPFMKNVYDKRQLSIKVTANSLYGQTGAKTSTFYEMDVAASTTAIGRKLLYYAKDVIEAVYKDRIVNTEVGQLKTNATYVYGDTDSVFFKFNFRELDGSKVEPHKALVATIEVAKEAGQIATKYLKAPHDLEYEKTFLPFALLSKKRYVGILYEENPNKGKCKSMGIVLKRRDNAPIVKDIYGGIIDILMKDKNIDSAIEFLDKKLNELVKETVDMKKLIITKSLRSFYKNPKQIAHYVLANRMGERDSGTKPKPGDRIPYVYIVNKDKKALQGEKIENPSYVIENNIKLDYSFYITNQIMKPVLQLFSLVLYDMKGFKRKKNSFISKIETLRQNMPNESDEDKKKISKKIQDLKDKEVSNLLFEKVLLVTNNNKNNNRMMTSFFKKKV